MLFDLLNKNKIEYLDFLEELDFKQERTIFDWLVNKFEKRQRNS